jgi:3',5'-cyclic-AMP phosphodiesterase
VPLRLLQFTDPHLPGKPGLRVRGVATEETLARCVAHAAGRHAGPRAVLLTGDLVHDDPAGYAAVRAQFGRSSVPVHCVPGNHDDAALARRELERPPFVLDLATRYGGWLVAMLDSTVAGAHHGHLTDDSLGRLDRALAEHRDAHALVCMHHHAVPHGSPWLDELMLDNADALFAVLARHPGVRGIAWGHTHQPLDQRRGAIRLMGTPSTCMQFTQNSESFEVDSRPPGYRWLELSDDGDIETGIEWVPHGD